MKKKMLAAVLALSVTVSPLALQQAIMAKTTTTTTTTTTTKTENGYDEDENVDAEADGLPDDDSEDDISGEFTKYDIRTTPAKKTIRVGSTFYIQVVAQDNSEWADLPDEEWDEICEENIDSITYRSTKSSVASVNKTTGKVKGKKKGTAEIKATINLVNGDTAVYKTKVYVTR